MAISFKVFNRIVDKKLDFKEIFVASLLLAVTISLAFTIRNYFAGEYFTLYYISVGFLFAFTVSFLIFSVNVSAILYLRKKAFKSAWTIKHYAWELLITSINAGIIASIIYLSFLFFLEFPEASTSDIFDHVLISMLINVVMVSILEGIYLLRLWKQSIVESEKHKTEAEKWQKANIQTKYESLKNQVNPHFLFNSLSVLSSLIPKSQEKAVEFVAHFSKIYRYVLENRDKTAIELGEELEFIRSYIFLQKIRYGKRLWVNINIDPEKIHDLVLPISMQLLVENAIKHNEISDSKPLTITIQTSDGYLEVINNLQKIHTQEKSTMIGLTNIRERYELVTDQPTEFTIRKDTYIARLPLLKEE